MLRTLVFQQAPADNQLMLNVASTEMERLFYTHSGRAIDKWRHYLEIYDRHLSKYRGKHVRLLEIGVSEGGSLQLWKAYFGPLAEIVGLDVNPRCKDVEEAQISIVIGNQADSKTLDEILDGLPFDIVIDDGSHRNADQIASFQKLYPMLAHDGIYICEDVHTSYEPEYNGGPPATPGTFVDFTKALIDQLNGWYHGAHAHRGGMIPGDIRFATTTFGMHFYDSLIVVEKRRQTRPVRVISGAPRNATSFSVSNETMPAPRALPRNTRRKNTKAVVHLARAVNGPSAIKQFLNAYRSTRVSDRNDIDLIILCKGENAQEQVRELLVTEGEARLIVVPDRGFDIGSYRLAATQLEHDLLCFVNSWARPLATDWSHRLFRVFTDPRIGLAGVTSSFEATSYPPGPFPNPHIRSTGFAMRRELFLDLDLPEPIDKASAILLEAGPTGLTRQVLQRGLLAVVVGADGKIWDVECGRNSGTYKSKRQQNLLVADNRTDIYLAHTPHNQAIEEMNAWGQYEDDPALDELVDPSSTQMIERPAQPIRSKA